MDKQSLRERVWDALEDEGVARFPFPPHGRIPNFAGADAAAERLTGTEAWRAAETVKANPDAPQLPVRRAALRAGKIVYMAVPRLRDERCFLELDPDVLEDYDAATTVSGIGEHGRQVGPDEMPEVDLVVSGSVAVSASGARIGKGEGFSDLEWAVLRELGLVDEGTPVATTVHELQVRDEEWVTDEHDAALDLVVTPERTVETGAAGKPRGIDWSLLSEADVAEMPVLERFRE
ncbi:5-formyltetrahydrofolate cyclo-ligase [Haloglomus litoreum]|uniref:5-formyltetrahydrofolate cyclo-ligase n=1 Tax=Haloglomus litoreum TaxID=3034026 RepID=UPI0023E75A71|nr:5-formyltetrahydrofolate cyclo-ligase [Haloglomus sp. DT116]